MDCASLYGAYGDESSFVATLPRDIIGLIADYLTFVYVYNNEFISCPYADGTHIHLYKDGRLSYVFNYRGGKRHGPQWSWFTSGVLHYAREFTQGVEHGQQSVTQGYYTTQWTAEMGETKNSTICHNKNTASQTSRIQLEEKYRVYIQAAKRQPHVSVIKF